MDWPADLRGVPCSREVTAVLQARGIAVHAGTVSHALPEEPAPPEDVLSPPTVSERKTDHALVFRYRPGERAYCSDNIGDGTNVIWFSYEGYALSFEISRPDLLCISREIRTRARSY